MSKMKDIDMEMQNDGLSYTRKGDLVTIRMAGVDAVQEFEVLEWTDPDAPLYTELYHNRQTAYTFSTMMIKAHKRLKEARAHQHLRMKFKDKIKRQQEEIEILQKKLRDKDEVIESLWNDTVPQRADQFVAELHPRQELQTPQQPTQQIPINFTELDRVVTAAYQQWRMHMEQLMLLGTGGNDEQQSRRTGRTT